MRVATPGRLRLIVTGLLTLSLVACSEGTGPEPEPARIDVSPEGPLDLAVGDTFTLRVQTSGATSTAVSFTASDSAVLGVTAGGLVTARGEGSATVTVTSQRNPDLTASVSVQVRPLTFEVDWVRTSMGVSVDPDAVRGQVLVGTSPPPDVASRIEILLDTVVVCTRDLAAAGSGFGAVALAVPEATEGCLVDTALHDSVTGSPRFRNGPVALAARLVGIGGQVLATSAPRHLTLANRNKLVGRVRASREAVDREGLAWSGGELTVTAVPVEYDPGTAVAEVTFDYQPAGRPRHAFTDSSPPFEAVISAGSLDGVLDPSLQVTLTSRTSGGADGPAGATEAVRYDQVAPSAGTLLAPEWVNGAFAFSRLLTPTLATDQGVGNIGARFFAGPPEVTGSSLIRAGVRVTAGTDLRPSQANGYRLAAEACDALENCVVVDGPTFGVDRQAPVVTQSTPPHRTVNPSDDLTVLVSDDRSEFGPGTVEARSTALIGGRTGSTCGPVLEGRDLPGRLVGGACIPDSMGILIPVPRATPGYYSYVVAPVDKAGNRGESLHRTFLVDLAPPRIGGISVPAQFVSGQEVSIEVVATDDTDLVESSVRLLFPMGDPAPLALPLAPVAAVGVAFDSLLTLSVTDTARFPFVRTLSHIATAGTGRRTVLVEALEAEVTDAAGRTTRSTRAIPPSAYGGNTSVADPFPGISSVSQALNTSRICSAACLDADPRGANLMVRISGESGLVSLPRMFVFRQRVTDRATVLLSSDAAPAVSDTGTTRTLTYNIPVAHPEGLRGEFRLFVVGVTSAGNGLKLDDLPVTYFAR